MLGGDSNAIAVSGYGGLTGETLLKDVDIHHNLVHGADNIGIGVFHDGEKRIEHGAVVSLRNVRIHDNWVSMAARGDKYPQAIFVESTGPAADVVVNRNVIDTRDCALSQKPRHVVATMGGVAVIEPNARLGRGKVVDR
jgi:hypothetical protein